MRPIASLVFAGLFASAAAHAGGALVNARIHTGDAAKPLATAMAWDDAGRITAIGDEVSRDADAIDAGGRTVVPGLIDAHGHLMGLGQALLRADLVGTTSKAEIVARLQAFE